VFSGKGKRVSRDDSLTSETGNALLRSIGAYLTPGNPPLLPPKKLILSSGAL